MLKLAISGKSGSGKDYAFSVLKNLIEEKYRKQVMRVAFADKLKEVSGILIPELQYEHLYGSSEHRSKTIEYLDQSIEVREIYKRVGESLKIYFPNIWVEHVHRRIKILNRLSIIPIITDLRFKNELYWLKENDFKILRINKLKNITENNSHPTDCELDDMKPGEFDFVIDNNFDNTFAESLEDMVKKL